MALIEGCKHSLDITVPVEEVESETQTVVEGIQKRAKLPGFRPGKVPATLVRKQFSSDVRRKVLENLIPRHLERRLREEELRLVGSPDITKVSLEPGQALEFTAEFEVAPEIELQEYRDLTVPYREPEVTDEDVAARLEEIRDRKATYLNVDPRPIEDGDHAVVALLSLAGVEGEPVRQDEMMLHIGAGDTIPAFSENLRGAAPGDMREFDVAYPAEYVQPKLAGKTVRFQVAVKGIRKKELPGLDDEFAKDVGDYQNLEELREEIRKAIFAERQHLAQEEAKNKLVEVLVDGHDFAVPETYIDRQIRTKLEQSLMAMAERGIDISKFKPDWAQWKESQRERATREVKASLLLGKVADAESINALRDEVDREVERYARQHREPVAAVRLRMEKDGSLGRIASQIQTQKTLTFLFEHARKVAD
ncbi:MAG: trigger factor [Acidobacteria bacterium]|nr:trigger factor [Acidobacteriota bacterium]